MRALLAPALVPGDRIGVVAPAGPVRRGAMARGMAVLRARGFEVVPGAHLFDRRAYLAGADRDRAADLNRMIADPSLRAVWFARGGYGSHRIVEQVDFRPLRRRPKLLIGYSDVTVLQAAAWRQCRLSTLQGPMVAQLGEPRAYDARSLWAAVSGEALEFALPARTILRPGRARAPIVGGCLAPLVALLGTPYMPPTAGAILFWEEVNEEPFRIDRMLAQLRLAGVLRHLAGMIVGRLVDCRARRPGQQVPLAAILATHLAGTRYPVVVDFPAGHCEGKRTLPLGRVARLDTSARRLTFTAAR
ncbi:MAG TPA: LD-carboxypeptidase [Patescibacteria group bacterium]|nr:LD-carboxypeptidase [Patescibacteria group bacterium]